MIDKLHYISQGITSQDHLQAIEHALQSGCKWIQLRIKNQSEAEVSFVATKAQVLCKQYNAKLIINDYPGIAKKIGCYGVHLGLQDMPIAQAREILSPKQIIGGTANTLADILARVNDGADYVGLGPYRFTRTKQPLSPIVGQDGYKKIMQALKSREIDTPIIAIGGIELCDIAEIIETGIHGVAVSGMLTNKDNATATIQAIQQIFENKPQLL
jgi:thiamine-phosphate pyrophosphorylase